MPGARRPRRPPSPVRRRARGPAAILAALLLPARTSWPASGVRAFGTPDGARPRASRRPRPPRDGGAALRGQGADVAARPGRGDGVVAVTTRRTLSEVTPRAARDAWLAYHWEQGGGLPLAVWSKELPDADGDRVRERTLVPLLMRERLEYDECDAAAHGSALGLRYAVTEAGPFLSDLIPGSHAAAVTFDAAGAGCVMTWHVAFATTRWAAFYEAVTTWTVGTAATTIQEASATPRRFSATAAIDGAAPDPVRARRRCLDFVFARGGGLPLLPPIPYGPVLSEGGGAARQNLLRIPPLLTESVVSTQDSEGVAEFTYRLNDPGWRTLPFLVHTHRGRVRFTAVASSLVIEWDVEIRPYAFAAPLVETLVEMTVATLLRNIRVLLTRPTAVAGVTPPSGKGPSVFTVPEETWLGGVLAAQSADTRPLVERARSSCRPWTWGRSGAGDENDAVQFGWADAHETTP